MNDEAEIKRQAENARLCGIVIAYWRAGNDTDKIAKAIRIGEPVVYRILATWRDLRWQMTQQQRARA